VGLAVVDPVNVVVLAATVAADPFARRSVEIDQTTSSDAREAVGIVSHYDVPASWAAIPRSGRDLV